MKTWLKVALGAFAGAVAGAVSGAVAASANSRNENNRPAGRFKEVEGAPEASKKRRPEGSAGPVKSEKKNNQKKSGNQAEHPHGIQDFLQERSEKHKRQVLSSKHAHRMEGGQGP